MGPNLFKIIKTHETRARRRAAEGQEEEEKNTRYNHTRHLRRKTRVKGKGDGGKREKKG